MIWRKGKVPQQWRYGKGVWIPKEENESNIKQFRTISLSLLSLLLCDMQDLLQDCCQSAHWIPFKEKLHRHLCAEGRDPWHTMKHRTHWHCNPTHQRSLREGLAGLCQCLWLDPTQASGIGPDQIPCTREDLEPHPGLLQQL